MEASKVNVTQGDRAVLLPPESVRGRGGDRKSRRQEQLNVHQNIQILDGVTHLLVPKKEINGMKCRAGQSRARANSSDDEPTMVLFCCASLTNMPSIFGVSFVRLFRHREAHVELSSIVRSAATFIIALEQIRSSSSSKASSFHVHRLLYEVPRFVIDYVLLQSRNRDRRARNLLSTSLLDAVQAVATTKAAQAEERAGARC